MEGGCSFCPQPGTWHIDTQKAFSPLGAYGPVCGFCLAIDCSLCAESVLVVFITLMLPQGLVCIYHAANVEVISSLVLGKQIDLYVSV